MQSRSNLHNAANAKLLMLRSSVFAYEVVLNINGFGRNLVEIIFGPSPIGHVQGLAICHQGAELLSEESENLCVLAIFEGF